MKKILLLIITTTFLLSCNAKDLRKIIDFKEPKKGERPCIVSVWPAVKSGDKKYKMNQKRANRFIIDVQAATGYNSKNYKRIKASKKIPKSCKQLLWHNGPQVPKAYRSCMTTWGKNTVKKYKSCANKGFVIGSAITSSNGKAKILIVNLENTKKYANKKSRYAKGKDLKRLARNIGKTIRKEIR
ncbi:hypothetical protein QUF74_13025 [Candidatus Halobeggiatoa sp. HSG11]|nr:hypothetical protein [Candidatus Halobeggiatoa sp. HSG11]